MAVDRKQERDIDVMLAEEFIVSPGFAARFLAMTRFGNAEAMVVDSFVSVVEGNTGESDLVVVFQRKDGSRFAVHVEDKIDAPLQEDQGKRYHRRAKIAVRDAHYGDYTVVLCAPRDYLASADLDGFEASVSYEEVAAIMLEIGSDARSRYRAEFLLRAASRAANRWKPTPDDATDAFWRAAYDIAVREFPSLEYKDRPFTQGNSWSSVSTRDMAGRPKRFRIDLKGPNGYVDLSITNCDINRLHPLVEPLLHVDMTAQQAGMSCVIRMRVPAFTISDGVEIGLPKVRESFVAASRLLAFFRKHKSELAQIAKDSERTLAA